MAKLKLGQDEAIIFAKHFLAFMMFAVLGWFVSWWNLSLVGVAFIAAVYSWKVTFEKSRREQAKQTRQFFRNERKAIQEIFEDIPRWIFFPDIERVEWINKIALQIWPDVTSYVHDFLKIELEPKIQKSLPEKFKGFKFKKIELGDMPPRITGVKVYKHHVADDEIIVDLDLFYAGNMALSIKISKFEAGIKDIQIKGTLRVVLKPLLKHLPFIGGLQLYFLTNPKLDFDFTDIARVLEVPGLHDLLRKVVMTQLSNYMILPNKIAFSLSSSVGTSLLRYTEPKGVLMVQVLEARNLAGRDVASKSDPYASISVGAQQATTATLKNTHNPIWQHEVHYFTVLELGGMNVDIELYDEDQASKDDFLGEVSIPLRTVLREGHVDTWKDLADGEGSLHFILTWYQLKPQLPPVTVGGKIGSQPAAVLSVFIDSAKDLQKRDGDKEPSTLVGISVATEEKYTSSVSHSANPSYCDNFHFLLRDVPRFETLTLKVCDANSDDILGTVTKALSDIAGVEGMAVHRPHPLTGGAGFSELIFRSSLKYLVASTGQRKSPDTDKSANTAEPMTSQHTDSVDTNSTNEEINADKCVEVKPDVDDNGNVSNGSIEPAADVVTAAKVTTSPRRRQFSADTDLTIPKLLEKRRRSSGVKTDEIGEVNVGDIELTFTYRLSENKLLVHVQRCRELLAGLAGGLAEDEAPNAYVKLCLATDRSHKFKTETYKESFYPLFNETFEFCVKSTELHTQSLEVTVKHYESLFNKMEIGHASIPLSTINVQVPTNKWYPLCHSLEVK